MVKKKKQEKNFIKFEKGAQYFLGEIKKFCVKEKVYASPSNIKVSSPMAQEREREKCIDENI